MHELGTGTVPSVEVETGEEPVVIFSALERMLGRVKRAQADALESPAVGEGTDLRFETERITGSALVRDEQVVHVEVHRVVRV